MLIKYISITGLFAFFIVRIRQKVKKEYIVTVQIFTNTTGTAFAIKIELFWSGISRVVLRGY